MLYPRSLAQAQAESQENGGRTGLPCLDNGVLACDDSNISTSTQKALGCSAKHNVVISRRNYHKHKPAPLSLDNWKTTASRYIADHKNRGQRRP